MADWIAHYDGKRFHSVVWYLPPDDVFYGRKVQRLAEREEKLHTASIDRQEYWRVYHVAGS